MAETPPRQRQITHRRVLAIALPIVLSNATVPILGVVDTGVVGQLGEAAPIAAVGVGAVIISAVYWIFGFLRMGTTGLTSQALGAEDQGEADALLSRALLAGMLGGILAILLIGPITWAAFWYAPATEAVETLAQSYIQIRIWSAPAAIALFGITGWLIANERTRAVLIMQVWMNGLNIILDLIFVLKLGWGVEGVAIATLIAEWTGLAVGLWFCRDAFLRPFWNKWARVIDKAKLLHMASVNGDILLRSLLLEAIFLSFIVFYSAQFGEVGHASNQILLQFLHVTAYGLDGFAFAAETLVGGAMGAKNPQRLRRAALYTSGWGLGLTICFSVCVAIWGTSAIDLMTTSEDVRENAKTYLPWMIAAPVVGVAAWMLDGIFIGATRTADMRNMMAISTAIYFIAVAQLVPDYGNHGLWAAMLISFVARGVSLGMRYPALERAAH